MCLQKYVLSTYVATRHVFSIGHHVLFMSWSCRSRHRARDTKISAARHKTHVSRHDCLPRGKKLYRTAHFLIFLLVTFLCRAPLFCFVSRHRNCVARHKYRISRQENVSLATACRDICSQTTSSCPVTKV